MFFIVQQIILFLIKCILRIVNFASIDGNDGTTKREFFKVLSQL